MVKIQYYIARESDLDFIIETYNENILSLHGQHRSYAVWEKIFYDKNSIYYIVQKILPVAWFRLDLADNELLWIGMIQVKPIYQHKGMGKYILSIVENIAKENGFEKIGVHTTADNIIARKFYLSSGYLITQIGSCTTADSKKRLGITLQKQILI